MLKLLLPIIGIISLLGQCEKNAPAAFPQLNVSDGTNEIGPRLAGECSFRYNIVNTSSQLDSASQTEAIRSGFRLWQRMSPNISFLEFSTTSRTVLQVKYVSAAAMMTKPVVVSSGLLPGEASVVSALQQNENGTYSILLSNEYAWNTNTITRAVAYQAGVLLGMAASTDRKSCMYGDLLNEKSTYSASDSLALKRLYMSPCGSYLPASLTVAGPVTKVIKFDRPGTIQINASGSMTVGVYVGLSTPDGRETGLFGFPLTAYNIVPGFFHAALMYKLNEEKSWHYCGSACNFSTAGNTSVQLQLNINDIDLTDNRSWYDVSVTYK